MRLARLPSMSWLFDFVQLRIDSQEFLFVKIHLDLIQQGKILQNGNILMKYKNTRRGRSILFRAAQFSYYLYQQLSQPKNASGGFGQIPEPVIQTEIPFFCSYITPIEYRSRLTKCIIRVRYRHFPDPAPVGPFSRFCGQNDFTRKGNIEIEEVIVCTFFTQTLSVNEQLHLRQIGIT